jgi:HSP20 family protein
MSLLVKRNGNFFPSVINDLFETDLLSPELFNFEGSLPSRIPSVNITEGDKNFKIELAAPGFDKKDFKVETDNGMLTISSEKEKEDKEETDNYRRREFSYSSFRRSFQLPENSIQDKIEAKYENGVLKLTLPKKEISISKPKKEIKIA